VAAGLTTSITAVATANCTVTATAALSTSITAVAAASCVITTSAGLSTSITAVATAACSLTTAADLTTQIALAALATGTVTTVADLVGDAALAGTATCTITTVADLLAFVPQISAGGGVGVAAPWTNWRPRRPERVNLKDFIWYPPLPEPGAAHVVGIEAQSFIGTVAARGFDPLDVVRQHTSATGQEIEPAVLALIERELTEAANEDEDEALLLLVMALDNDDDGELLAALGLIEELEEVA
jgi:hypothetical protein